MPAFKIRPATVDDARGINPHVRRIADEPNNTISYSQGEFQRTIEEERERIGSVLTAGNSHMLVAVVDDEIIGICACYGGSRVGRYTACLGMSVHPAWRDHGVGTALLEALIQWVRMNPALHRLDLEVYTYNQRAIHVYKKLGFQEEGIRKEAYFKDGRFVDTLTMAIIFDDSQ